MEYLTFEFGFCIRSNNATVPCVKLEIDQVTLVDEYYLTEAGSVDDLDANMHWINIDSLITDQITAQHTIKVYALNNHDDNKIYGDFGFQLRSIRVNGIILEHFLRPGVVYNTITHPSYITEFLQPNGRLHEIEYIDAQPYHVEKGDYANYINSKGGWWEMTFSTPLYKWIAVDNNFGAMHQWLIREHE